MASPLIAAYICNSNSLIHVGSELHLHLQQLVRPSLGHWVGIVRELARVYGSPAQSNHPLHDLWRQLAIKSSDRPAMLALFRRIKNGPDGSMSRDRSCSILEVIESLVQYRNVVFGHGAPRSAHFYEDELGPLLFPAANELLDKDILSPLGPPASQLVLITDVHAIASGEIEIGLKLLTGIQGERMQPLRVPREITAAMVPGKVAVLWPGYTLPLRLDPLLIFRELVLNEEVLFLNCKRGANEVEYLSYVTGEIIRNTEMARELRRLVGSVGSSGVDNTKPQRHNYGVRLTSRRVGFGILFLFFIAVTGIYWQRLNAPKRESISAPASGSPADQQSTLNRTIREKLVGLECSRLHPHLAIASQVMKPPEQPQAHQSVTTSYVLTLSGFARDATMVEAVRNHFRSIEGIDTVVTDAIDLATPFCPLIEEMEATLQGTARLNTLPQLRFNRSERVYRNDELLVLEAINVSETVGYLYLDLMDSNFGVLHLLPTKSRPQNFVSSGETVTIGFEDELTCSKNPFDCISVYEPHGNNMILMIWSKLPLFAEPRAQEKDTLKLYLSAVKGAVDATRSRRDAAFAVAYYFFETSE